MTVESNQAQLIAGPKILLVEDNDMNRDMLTRRLQRKGYEIVVAINGNEALATVKSEQPDLILMDLGLPEMDGWEATRRLKADTWNVSCSLGRCALSERLAA